MRESNEPSRVQYLQRRMRRIRRDEPARRIERQIHRLRPFRDAVVRDRNVDRLLHRDAAAVVRAQAAQVRGVDQRAVLRVLRHGRIRIPVADRAHFGLERGHQRTIGGRGIAGDPGIASTVDRDRGRVLEAGAAEERRIHQRLAVGRELGHDDVVAAVVGRIDRARCRGPGAVLVVSGDVRAPRGIDGDGIPVLLASAANVGRECHDRVDDQRPRAIPAAKVECDLDVIAGLRHAKCAVDAHAPPVDLLVRHGTPQGHVAGHGIEADRTVGLARRGLLPFVAQADRRGIRTRRHHEVVLEPAALAVPHEIDARIDARLSHAREVRDVAQPFRRIAPGQEVAAGRERSLGGERLRQVGIDQLPSQRGARRRRHRARNLRLNRAGPATTDPHADVRLSQCDVRARTARDEPHGRWRLPHAALEGERPRHRRDGARRACDASKARTRTASRNVSRFFSPTDGPSSAGGKASGW